MNCQIRKWKIEDAADLANVLNNKKILNNLRDGLPYPYKTSDAEDYIHAMLSADLNKTYAFAITADDKVIGSIGLFRRGNIHYQTAELGYYIAESYWGQGFGTEAVRQICSYAFEYTDIMRIFAEPFSHNIGSCRILEKNGFICEGVMRSNAVKNRKVLDMKLYARINESCR